jgi:hypothetical protein
LYFNYFNSSSEFAVAQSKFTVLLIFRQSAVACYKFGVAHQGICGESLATDLVYAIRSLKLNQNTDILKEYFKRFGYEDIWKFLSPNILSLHRDYLLSDCPLVVEEVVSFWP